VWATDPSPGPSRAFYAARTRVDRASDFASGLAGRRRKAGLTSQKWGYGRVVRIGNVVIRPLGGVPGCLMMILVSVLLSAILTIAANLLFR
jgi:hypothetical protein